MFSTGPDRSTRGLESHGLYNLNEIFWNLPTPALYEQALLRPTSRALAIRAKCWDCEGQNADPGSQRCVRTCGQLVLCRQS